MSSDAGRSDDGRRLFGDLLPVMVWTATPDGLVDRVCGGSLPAARRIALSAGGSWLDLLHHDDEERVRAAWRHALHTGEPCDAQGRLLVVEGSYRRHLIRGVCQHDGDGKVQRWAGFAVDIDDLQSADDSHDIFVALAEHSCDIVGISDVGGNLVYVNPAARAFLALDDPRAMHFLECFNPEDQQFVKSVVLPAMERDGRWIGEFRMRNFRTGADLPILYNAFVLRNASGEYIGTATISRDLRERNRIDLGMEALAGAGAVMYGSLDYEETLRNIADAVAKTYATSCTIDIVDGQGMFRRVAIAHPRPEKRAILEDFSDQRRFQPRHPVYEAIRHGASTCVTNVDTWAASKAASDSTIAAIDKLGIRSFMTVPLGGPDGLVLGALTCSRDRDDPRPPFIPDDLIFAEELGWRGSVAVRHARAYEHERAIAMRFQEASLPRVLPSIAGATLSADYRPGSSEATIGGDWFDAFLLEDGRLVITVGDVVGKGLDAAVTMAKLRQSMRCAAALVPEPNAILGAADRTVREVSADTYATATAGIYDPQRREFTFASAGHPGPTLVRGDGSIDDYTSPGIMLGLRPADASGSVTVCAPRGSVLVFFTDGLTETTHDIDEGLALLHAVLSDGDVIAAENPARAIVDRVLDGRPATDDVAVLAVRFT